MIIVEGGGICTARGFRANGVHCGIRKNKTKKDLALVVADCPCSVAATYTTNLVKGAPLVVTRRHVALGTAQAIICNSGNANTCNADGEQVAEEMCALVEKALGIPAQSVIVSSTGVIGQPLDITPIADAMSELSSGLGDYGYRAAEAIMTTDTTKKELAVQVDIGGATITIGGMAKGSGMIHPNMATMLVFLTTDAVISSDVLQKLVSADVPDSFNMITVDGDTSTNDMLTVLASGMAGNAPITEGTDEYFAFAEAFAFVTRTLSRMIAADGEGASKLVVARVFGADSKQTARIVAKSVVGSSLLKAAMFGADANWGRVLCAVGYSGATVDVDLINVDFVSRRGTVPVCRGGRGIPFSETIAKDVLSDSEIDIIIDLQQGAEYAEAYGCDLTYEYVRINGDYRT